MKRSTDSPYCGICDRRAEFDNFQDINRCDWCGAQEIQGRWEKRDLKAKIPAPKRAKQLKFLWVEET